MPLERFPELQREIQLVTQTREVTPEAVARVRDLLP